MTTQSLILTGDCRAWLSRMPDNCIDAVVTDPPYGLSSREPDMVEVLTHWLAGDDYVHGGGGFMGKTWDSFVPGPSIWREVFRVLKPGGHALVFAGTRTYDLMTLSLRLAGFEVRDQLAWMYGSGFPKSMDVSNATAAAQWSGWGTALKPAQEPIALVRKPLIGTIAKNVLAYGTGGINVDGCRIGSEGGTRGTNYAKTELFGIGGKADIEQLDAGRWPANVILDETAAAMLDAQTGEVSKSSKPRVLRRGLTTGTSIGGHGKYNSTATTHEAVIGYNDSGGASRFFYVAKTSKAERERGLAEAGLPIRTGGELTDREDGSDGLNSPRAGAGRGGGRRNHHPTVKPIALMRYLVRLITPPDGLVLDPFTGSGTTGCAAKLEGFSFLGCELDPDYVTIAQTRIAAV